LVHEIDVFSPSCVLDFFASVWISDGSRSVSFLQQGKVLHAADLWISDGSRSVSFFHQGKVSYVKPSYVKPSV
jgi:hypothetical protein